MSLGSSASGLATAASWGAGDFSGGLAARKQHVFVVVLISQAIGAILVGVVAIALGESLPGSRDVLLAAAAGLAGAVGVTALYASLAAGRMGIAAPITGVIAAILPVAYAWATRGAPSAWGYGGVAVALLGIVFVSGPRAERPEPRVLALAVISGCGFAGFLVVVTRKRIGAPSPWVLGACLGDTMGNAFYLLATRLGRLDVAVVLSALYPVTTIVLARLVLKEHMTRMQAAGAVLMVAAIPMVILA